MKKKICFVIQRYGLEVNGGAELHCRQLAEHMLDRYDVSVITTKAKDYTTWKNEYENDEDVINGIRVMRYPTEQCRDMKKFNPMIGPFIQSGIGNKEKEMEFLKEQGPYCPALIEAIREKKDEYDVFIFYTYLYYTTILGVPEVADKAILVPTAHDEPFIHMSVLRPVFTRAKGILFLTERERRLVHRLFRNKAVPNEIGGVGIEIPETVDRDFIKKKFGFDEYVVYVGRIDAGKLCNVLFKYFAEYKKRNKNDLKLVLVGKEFIPVPKHPDIVSLGFVSEQEKFDVIAGSTALILPSQFESLSMVVLEAMRLSVPVIINGDCEVVKDHCLRSNAGLYYRNYFEFEGIIEWMRSHPEEMEVMGRNGVDYVLTNYTWEIITSRLSGLIENIAGKE